jgi:hypothetical protein
VLSVASGRQPQVDVLFAEELRGRKHERSIQLTAIRREQIDFTLAVRCAYVTAGGAPRRSEQDDHDIAGPAQASPLDLHPEKLTIDV